MNLPARHAAGYLRNGELITLSPVLSLMGERKAADDFQKGARMKKYCLYNILLLIVFALMCGTLHAEPISFISESITLPQSDDILQIRLASTKEIAAYVKQIEFAAKESFQLLSKPQPTTGAIVVAVKPGYQARFWLLSSEYPINTDISQDFQARFDKIRPMTVQQGPIAFSINFTINGGGKPLKMEGNHMPIPEEWRKAAEKSSGSLTIPDGYLALVWPDEPLMSKSSLTIPEGYELQTLDVTKGSILKPKGWFYTFGGDQHSVVWTISKENPKPKGYKTGLRLQFFPGVSKTVKMSPQAAAQDIISQIKKKGEILKMCDPHQIGDFTRIFTETKEAITISGIKDDYHIIYTTSWSDKLDMVTLLIFGTPYDEWDKYQDIYDQIKNVVLIGEDFWKTTKAESSDQQGAAKH